MKRDELIFILILVVFFGFMLFQSLGLHGVRRFGEMGSGFWPILVLAMALILSGLLLGTSFYKYQEGKRTPPSAPGAPGEGTMELKSGRKKFALTVIFLLLYILVMPWAGFIASTGIYVFVFILALGERRKPVLAISPILVTAMVVVVFVKFLSIPLPKGVGVFATLSRFFY